MRLLSIGLLLLCLVSAETRANDRIVEAARQYLVERFDLDPNASTVTMRENKSFETVLPTDDIHVYSTTSRPPRGVYGLKFEIIRDGSVVKTISSPVRVTLWADAFIATRRIRKDEQVGQEDFRIERIDATKCYDKLRSITESLDGMRAGRMIMSGKALEHGMLESIPVINRGDKISIKCRVGAMDIMTTGVAKEDGCLGDQINVVNIQTKRKIVAVVDGPGVAVVRQ